MAGRGEAWRGGAGRGRDFFYVSIFIFIVAVIQEITKKGIFIMYETISFHWKGVSPLICHNGDLANPANTFSVQTKKFTSKRKKTESDYEEIARLGWFGALYLNEDKKPIIPGEVIEGFFNSAAKKNRLGQKAKSGIICESNPEIIYKGSSNIDKLFKDKNFVNQSMVKVQTSKVLRTRPIFKNWELKFKLHFMSNVIDREDIIDIAKIGGSIVGIGDWRPKHGRFEIINAV